MYHDDAPSGRVAAPARVQARFPELDPRLWGWLADRFPVKLTESWLARLRTFDDPLARQVLPLASELVPDPGDVPDPVGEQGGRPHPRIVQKHADRALLLVTQQCHLHCRYCFRREPDGRGEPSREELQEAVEVLLGLGLSEVILSGGDPLVLTDSRLFELMDALRPGVPLLRLHTRAPITAPDRVTPALARGLGARAPVWMVVHCNHPDELTVPVRSALARLVDAGVPLRNQSVLLAGVNDDPDVLEALSRALLCCRVDPYYLHHPDAVPGTASWRVDIERGLAVYAALIGRLGGTGLPRYVIDPPDGSGKIEVAEWARREAGR